MLCYLIFFCFNDTGTTDIHTYLHTLSLHDARPISGHSVSNFLIAAAPASSRKSVRVRGFSSSVGFCSLDLCSCSRCACASAIACARYFGSIWSGRSEEHTSELQSLMRISYAVFCLKKKNSREKHIIV